MITALTALSLNAWPRVANGRSQVRLVAGNRRRPVRVGAGRLFRMAGEVQRRILSDAKNARRAA